MQRSSKYRKVSVLEFDGKEVRQLPQKHVMENRFPNDQSRWMIVVPAARNVVSSLISDKRWLSSIWVEYVCAH